MTSKAWRSEKVYRSRTQIEPWVNRLEGRLQSLGEVWTLGSWRRGATVIGDLDIVIVTEDGVLPEDLVDKLDGLVEVQTAGPALSHCNIPLPEGDLHVDFYACTPIQRGAFLWFLTGPKNLNIQMRAEAQRRGWMLSQYGLFDGDKQLDNGTELNIALLLDWMRALDPHAREAWAEPKPVKVLPAASSDGVTQYTVTVDGEKASCTCPGFKYRRHCRHIKEAKA